MWSGVVGGGGGDCHFCFVKCVVSKCDMFCSSLGGVVMVSLSDLSLEADSIPTGALWSLASAMLYAFYLVMVRRRVGHEDRMDIPMFFGEYFPPPSLLFGWVLLVWNVFSVFSIPPCKGCVYWNHCLCPSVCSSVMLSVCLILSGR